jgi:threonine dehydrogenase-like Zn-dependent dehydrogenase
VSVSAEIVWLKGPGDVVLRAETLAGPATGELLCETIVTAISPGTELAAYTGQPPLRPGAAYPRLQGYCNVARVLESAAGGFAAGDRVLTFSSHRSHFLIEAEEVLLKLPAGADADRMACAYLYHLGYNAVLRSDVRPGSRVLVIGLGALGLTSVAMAAIAGATVFAVSDQAAPARLAVAMGATVFERSEEDLLAAELGGGADVVIHTVNGWSDWQVALRLAGQNGVIACLGFPGRGEPPPEANPLDSRHFYLKQLRIEAVGMSPEVQDSRGFLRFNERDNLAWIASLIASGRLDPSPLVSGRYPGHEIARAYEDLLARKGSPVTFLLDWADE